VLEPEHLTLGGPLRRAFTPRRGCVGLMESARLLLRQLPGAEGDRVPRPGISGCPGFPFPPLAPSGTKSVLASSLARLGPMQFGDIFVQHLLMFSNLLKILIYIYIYKKLWAGAPPCPPASSIPCLFKHFHSVPRPFQSPVEASPGPWAASQDGFLKGCCGSFAGRVCCPPYPPRCFALPRKPGEANSSATELER